MSTSTLMRTSALVGVMFATVATAAYAQDTDGPRQVEEVVVTAQKREQSLQDVPIVVTSVSGQLLQDAGVRDIRELTLLTPGLTVTTTSNETIVSARIRGVGTVGDNPGLESSVGVVIDGVYRPRNGVSFGDLGETQRIEVLKGPQGTLFGKNTSAGVINIITAGPTRDFRAQSEATFGNYGQVGLNSSISGPLSETLSGRLYVGGRVRDGFQKIVKLNGNRSEARDNDQNFFTGRGQLLFEPSSDLSLRLIADYTKRDENCCVGTQLFVGQSAAGRGQIINSLVPGSLDLTSTPFDRIGYANRPTDQRVKDRGISAEVNWDVSDAARLTSVTALRKWDAATGQDSDFTAADLVYRPNDGSNNVGFKQFSQELRLAGEAGPLNWLVGAFAASEELDNRQVLSYGRDYYNYVAGRLLGGVPALLGLTPGRILQEGNGSDDTFHQNGKTLALFTNDSFKLTDALELTVGLRYTKDKKDLTTQYRTSGSACDQGEAAFGLLAQNPLLGATPAARLAAAQTIVGTMCVNLLNNDFDELGVLRQERTEEKWTGTAKLQYRFSPDLMTYASYSRGYKAGGYDLDREQRIIVTATGPNFTADTDTSFRPEMVDSYELGAKTSLFGNSLLFNVAAFYQEFEDFQLNTFVGTAFVVETLPKVRSRGIDADFIYAPPIRGLNIQGGVTYAETEVRPFTAAQLIDPTRFSALYRLPGAQLSFAPRWSGSVAASYEHDLGTNLSLRSNVSAKYTSRYNTGSDLHPSKVQDDMVLVNGRIGVGPRDDRWAFELWANNIFDKQYLQVGFNGPYQVDAANDSVSVYDAFLGAPRTYGATLRFKY